LFPLWGHLVRFSISESRLHVSAAAAALCRAAKFDNSWHARTYNYIWLGSPPLRWTAYSRKFFASKTRPGMKTWAPFLHVVSANTPTTRRRKWAATELRALINLLTCLYVLYLRTCWKNVGNGDIFAVSFQILNIANIRNLLF